MDKTLAHSPPHPSTGSALALRVMAPRVNLPLPRPQKDQRVSPMSNHHPHQNLPLPFAQVLTPRPVQPKQAGSCTSTVSSSKCPLLVPAVLGTRHLALVCRVNAVVDVVSRSDLVRTILRQNTRVTATVRRVPQQIMALEALMLPQKQRLLEVPHKSPGRLQKWEMAQTRKAAVRVHINQPPCFAQYSVRTFLHL